MGQLHNPNFKGVEFDSFRAQAGANAFTMSPKKWIEATDAIGIVSKAGRYGGTYAHSDIALEFASWVSPEFKLYIIKDYNPNGTGNIRYQATIYQLLVLANMESYNAVLIQQGKSQAERMILLHELAVQQMKTISHLDLNHIPGIDGT